MPVKAILISIGDEILYGQTLDTNSHWMSKALDYIGIQVVKKITVGDVKEEIFIALEEAKKSGSIILLSGGLGPTNDDITKISLVEYFNTRLVRNEKVLQHIQNIFTMKGKELMESHEKQADLPANCTPIINTVGTASGMWFEFEGKVLVAMPGVPFEMIQLMNEGILPKLKQQFLTDVIYHRMIRTIGIGESSLALIIKEWEEQLPKNIKLAYLPTMGAVKLRLTTSGEIEEVKQKLQHEIDTLLPLIDTYVYGLDDESIEEAIGRMLKECGYKLAIAESCTGGYFSHKITSVAGSSAWFKGAIVPYSNELKRDQLGVAQEILEKHGAVSEPVVLALAKNVRKLFHCDVGVSISGIAGPGGGSKEKPIGTVWIGYSDKNRTVAKKFQFVKGREIIIKYSVIAALNMIRMNLAKN